MCPVCEKLSSDGFTHERCKSVFGIDGHICLFSYEGVIRKALIALKYKYAFDVVSELVGYGMEQFETKKHFLPKFDYFVPIPLYWYRENIRGFNQSGVIGEAFAKALKLKFASNLLMRKRLGSAQVELRGEQRAKNVKGVFLVNPNFVPGRKFSVLIFDDVYTTGSTLKEACRVLKQKGANKVWGLTFAK